ncbi:MAG TPA: PQQ-dependent sugar dehydrogenase [Opitutaceae bacterium]|nr:PQQ-dependent sugar dehydrogenase [Opitutaceae bacterium]
MLPSSLRRACFVLLPCFAAAGLHAQPQPAAGRSVTKLYTDLCLSCHGQKWEGGRAPSMLDDVWMHESDDEGLARSIRDGWPVNAMPGFGAVLNPQEIRAMVVFIRESRERAKQEKKTPPPEIDGVQFNSEKQRFKIEVVAAGLETPWGMAFMPDGRLMVTERPGRLRIVAPGKGVVETISGVPKVWLKQDGGLFDLALHPNFAREPWVYLAYSDTGGAQANASGTTIIRAKLSGNALVDHQTLFKAPPEQYWVSNTHYGARFLFDRAGFLYFSIGDRGRRDEAQNLASPYGKFHRIHDDGRVPADNPFVNTPGAVKTIWSWGHRNQQGMAQNPTTGEIWTTEHGPRGGDELNVIGRGKNYGWPVITYGMNDDGTPITDQTAKAGMEQPVAYWTPSIAVSGIEFYSGDKFPAWRNNLFMAALAGRQFRRIEMDGHKVTHQEVLLQDLGRRVRDVQAGPDGLIYVLLNMEFGESPGHVIRLVPVAK